MTDPAPYAGVNNPDTLVPEQSDASGRPEVLVGAAFAGGVVLALLLKRAGRVS